MAAGVLREGLALALDGPWIVILRVVALVYHCLYTTATGDGLARRKESSEGMGATDIGVDAGVSAPQTQLGHIFISYARVDARQANQVMQVLAAWGCATWMDRKQLGGGQNWTAELERAIEESAALVLVLTPDALRSPMVRREYQQALRCNIPVALVEYRPVTTLPPELAHVPRIDMRQRLHSFPRLFFVLADRGLVPLPRTYELESQSFTAIAPTIFAVTEGRIPSDWHVYQAPWSSYLWRMLGRFMPVFIFLLALNLPSSWWRSLMQQQDWFWVTNIIGVGLLLLTIYSALPVAAYLLVLMRRAQPEMIVLGPEWCIAYLIHLQRLRIVSTPHRYEYRWATEARVERDRWGAVRVVFKSGVGGPQVSLRIPWVWRHRAAIAQQIVEDAQTFQRQSVAARELLSAAEAPSASSTEPPEVDAPSASVQSSYVIIAPRSARAVIASVQAWLTMRGLSPAEMIWTPDAEWVLAPTARGAAQCRLVLFVDAPTVTQSPRWSAVLHDLRQQDKLLIPLREQAEQLTPSEWSSLQWVDFSPAVSRERSFLSLCDTLDRNGLLPSPGLPVNLPYIDTELALARATYQRLPSDWRVFSPEPAARDTQRRARTTTRLLVVFLMASMVFTVAYQLAIAHSLSLDSWMYLGPLGAVVATVALQRSAPLWQRLWSAMRKTPAQGDPMTDFKVPEYLIITPYGIVFHLLNSSGSKVARRLTRDPFLPDTLPRKLLHGSVTFAQIRAIEGRTGLTGARSLHMRMHDGGVIEAPLVAFVTTADLVIDHALAALNSYRTMGQGAGDGSHSDAGQ